MLYFFKPPSDHNDVTMPHSEQSDVIMLVSDQKDVTFFEATERPQ